MSEKSMKDNWSKIMKEFFREYVSEFEEKTEDLPKHYGGISRSEAFAFCALCKMFMVDLVIDSGTGYGISTEYFARIFDFVYSIDNHKHYGDSLEVASERLQEYDNLELIEGNAYIEIPRLIETVEHERCAIFFDGPKGEKAFNFCQKRELDLVFAGFHDASPEGRADTFFKELEGTILHTSYGWFPEEFNYLNKKPFIYKDEKGITIRGFPNGPGAVFYWWGLEE